MIIIMMMNGIYLCLNAFYINLLTILWNDLFIIILFLQNN